MFYTRYMTTWSEHNSHQLAKNQKYAWTQQDVLQREHRNDYESFSFDWLLVNTAILMHACNFVDLQNAIQNGLNV